MFFKKTFFLFNPTFILLANCIKSRTVNQNINMIYCLIKDFSSSDSGGAILINTAKSININGTTFYSCFSTNGHGGAIWFDNGLNINLFRICAVRCSAFNRQFAYLETTYNQLLDLITIYNCSNINGYQPLNLAYGNQNISNLNMSYNNNNHISGINYYNPNSMLSSYCTFYNNSAGSTRCIQFYGNSGTISKSNIILNNSPTNYGVVYVNTGNYILKECIFDQNKNTLLYVVSSCTLQLINCYYLTGSSSTFGSVLFSNPLITADAKYYINSIYFTYYCSYSSSSSNILNPSINIFKYQIIRFYFKVFLILYNS